jgi:hypothetical protein
MRPKTRASIALCTALIAMRPAYAAPPTQPWTLIPSLTQPPTGLQLDTHAYAKDLLAPVEEIVVTAQRLPIQRLHKNFELLDDSPTTNTALGWQSLHDLFPCCQSQYQTGLAGCGKTENFVVRASI